MAGDERTDAERIAAMPLSDGQLAARGWSREEIDALRAEQWPTAREDETPRRRSAPADEKREADKK